MFNNLPGVLVNVVDNGLAARRAPKAHSTLIIGTSDKGTADQPFQVTDRAQAALAFGFSGTLIRAMEEVATAGSDNIVLYRMGTSPMQLNAIGLDHTSNATTPGFSISFGERAASAPTDYTIWYKNGVLWVWLSGNVVYSNDVNAPVDTGDLTITGTISGNAGLQLGSGSSASSSAAITITAAAALTGSSDHPAPILVQPVTGIGLTGRQTYIALLQALDLLNGIQVEQIICPNVTMDAPNVAYYVSSDATTSANNPATNPDALDWIKTITDSVGNKTWQWASDSVDSGGNTVTPMSAVSATARIAAGFYEASPAYLLANFSYTVSTLNNQCVGIIGTSVPKTLKLADVRNWVGFLPTYDANGVPTAPGKGLLGIPSLVGTTAAKLNPLCIDFSSGHRLAGLFANAVGQKDGGAMLDKNGNPIDIGAFLHVVADQAVLTNGWAANYLANLAPSVAGLLSVLDEKSGLTNKPLKVLQVPGLVYIPGQLDALTQAKINVLRSKGLNSSPVLLHDMTAATDASDYTNLVRVRVKGLVVSTLLQRADKFIGEASIDGLQLTAMKTALDADLVSLSKRGYISKANVSISSSDAEQRIGHATLELTFAPANELIQLTAYVGLSR